MTRVNGHLATMTPEVAARHVVDYVNKRQAMGA